MRRACLPGGLSLAEMLVSMGASVVVIGGLITSTMAIQRAVRGSESYAGSYSDQRRLIDYVGRDLRRAVAIACTDLAGTRQAASGTIQIGERATLVLTLPGFYKSNAPDSADYDRQLPVIRSQERFEYGGSSGPAPTVEVVFRKVFIAEQGCVCFVRQEAGEEDVIVRGAENLHVQVVLSADGRTGLVKAWFRGPYSGASPVVSTYDELMLRNSRLEGSP